VVKVLNAKCQQFVQSSLQFAVNSSFMKIVNTKCMNVVSECLDMFHVLSVADYIVKRNCKFLTGYINSQNSLWNLLWSKKDLSDMTLRWHLLILLVTF